MSTTPKMNITANKISSRCTLTIDKVIQSLRLSKVNGKTLKYELHDLDSIEY